WLIGLPPTANLAVEGITDRPNQESQTAIKPACTPGFLAKSITCSGQIIAIDPSLPNSSRTTKYIQLFHRETAPGAPFRVWQRNPARLHQRQKSCVQRSRRKRTKPAPLRPIFLMR